MPYPVRLLALSLLLVASTGCLHNRSTTETSIDGRTVTATTHTQQSVGLSAFNDHATLRFTTLEVEVTPDTLSWPPNHTLPLPAKWNRLDFDDTGTQITVRLDHHAFATIPTSPISH